MGAQRAMGMSPRLRGTSTVGACEVIVRERGKEGIRRRRD